MVFFTLMYAVKLTLSKKSTDKFSFQIDLDEIHLTKALADFVSRTSSSPPLNLTVPILIAKQGGHYMRPDLISLVVDSDRKDLIRRVDKDNGGVVAVKTIDRIGLSIPLAALDLEKK